MSWYYAEGTERKGPFAEAEFDLLVGSGTVKPDTLVWQEGMANWAPLAEVRPPQPASAPPLVPPLMVASACSVCGGQFPLDLLVQIGGSSVCAGCKPLRVQQLKEGVAAGDDIERLHQLLKVAKAQKGVTWCILLGILLYAVLLSTQTMASQAAMIPMVVATLGILILLPFQLIYIYRLADGLQVGTPVLWVLGVAFCSCIGLILLLILSSKATAALRQAGFRVGLMGADVVEIENAIARGR